MTLPLKFSRAGKRDIDLAFVWYEQQRAGLGDSFLAAIEESLEFIQRNPKGHAVVRSDLRIARVTKFPYLIVYRLLTDRIRISAVVHGARHPRYWRDQG
jgi:plasmid stabilization system protein ParE